MLAGSSGLTYPLGNEPDSGMHLHIAKNSGGEFCGDDEWVVVGDILQALKTRPDGKPVTSILLNPLLRGKSVNTRGFLLQHSCTRSGLSEAPPTPEFDSCCAHGRSFLRQDKRLRAMWEAPTYAGFAGPSGDVEQRGRLWNV
jgi:hypothetical protein